MTVLGLETSSAVCSVGIAWDEGKRLGRSLTEERIHSEKLMTLTAGVLTEAAMKPSELSGVAVSGGPGSFTGLRIGMSSAKGLSRSLGIPLVVVPTFEALAEAVRTSREGLGNLLIALDARQGDFYVQRFDLEPGRAVAAEAAGIVALQDLAERCRQWDPDLVVTDVSRFDSICAKVLAVRADEFFRGDVVASLGLASIRAGRLTNPVDAEPIYLKDFVVRQHRVPS